jgi:ketosteroid isomerase-like protein
MTVNDLAKDETQAVLQCQQQFWQALQHKDAHLFIQVLADDFVCRSPNQPDQARPAFIQTITAMPVAVISASAEQIAIQLFGPIAVLTGTQVARLRLPDGSDVYERLALTNVFRQTGGQWQMVFAHPVLLSNASSG